MHVTAMVHHHGAVWRVQARRWAQRQGKGVSGEKRSCEHGPNREHKSFHVSSLGKNGSAAAITAANSRYKPRLLKSVL
jgi:hypothetical protein